ncbi:MAG: hypothetical protein ACI3XE_05355, partial [Eubacteriales bacterium]
PAESLTFLKQMKAATDASASDLSAPHTLPNETPPAREYRVDTPVLGAKPTHAAPTAAATPHDTEQSASPTAPAASPVPQESTPAAVPQETISQTEEVALPAYRYLGCAFRCYLLVELDEELLVIDRHAAHERILFERLLAEQKKEGKIPSQGLLVPLTVPLTPEEYAAAEEAKAELEDIGFTFYPLSDGRGVSLATLPNRVSPAEALDLFTAMAGDLAEARGTPDMTQEKRRERALYQVACKAAVKGGRTYTEEQLIHLVEEVLRLPDITVCPHGRPIAYRLTKKELDKQFDRIK